MTAEDKQWRQDCRKIVATLKRATAKRRRILLGMLNSPGRIRKGMWDEAFVNDAWEAESSAYNSEIRTAGLISITIDCRAVPEYEQYVVIPGYSVSLKRGDTSADLWDDLYSALRERYVPVVVDIEWDSGDPFIMFVCNKADGKRVHEIVKSLVERGINESK